MLGKTNSSAGGSSGQVAQYDFRTAEIDATYPKVPLTELFKVYERYEHDEFAVQTSFSLSTAWEADEIYKAFDGNDSTYCAPPSYPYINLGSVFFIKKIRFKLYNANSGMPKIIASETWLSNEEEWDVLYNQVVEASNEWVDVPVNKNLRYFVFKSSVNSPQYSRIEIIAATAGPVCALSSPNMTPSFNAYLNNYMELVTLPYFAGQTFVPSQVKQLKPFAEGGCLIDYDDNGQPVRLELFLLTPTSSGEYAYALATAAGFELPEGYVAADQVGSLNLPAHIVKVVEERDFIQPALTANGIVGGADFAVAADSEIDSARAAWKAFDGNTVLADAGTDQAHTGSGQPHWFEFYNPNPLQVMAMTVYNGGDNVLPKDWQFQASADGMQWDVLTAGSNENSTAGGAWSFTIPAQGWYKYHRFYVTSGSGADGGYTGITEFVITARERAESWQMPGD